MNSGQIDRLVPYGGDWTVDKLELLREYADAYTTALKGQVFDLIYLDAFAGEGAVAIKGGRSAGKVIEGSAAVACRISNKPFDRLRFIEKDPAIASRLTERLNYLAAGRDFSVVNCDANRAVVDFCDRMGPFERALVLLDPFATEVSWPTVQALAATRKCDVLILFPVMAVRRLVKRFDDPNDARFKDQLTRIYGDLSWQELYKPRVQRSLFPDDPEHESERGYMELVDLYQRRLNGIFADSVSKSLLNQNRNRLFEFIVAWGDPKGARVGKRIASWIISREEPFTA